MRNFMLVARLPNGSLEDVQPIQANSEVEALTMIMIIAPTLLSPEVLEAIQFSVRPLDDQQVSVH